MSLRCQGNTIRKEMVPMGGQGGALKNYGQKGLGAMRCSTKIPPPLAPVLSVVHGLQNTFVMNVHHTTLLNALARTRVFFGASAPWEIGSVTGAPFGWGGFLGKGA